MQILDWLCHGNDIHGWVERRIALELLYCALLALFLLALTRGITCCRFRRSIYIYRYAIRKEMPMGRYNFSIYLVFMHVFIKVNAASQNFSNLWKSYCSPLYPSTLFSLTDCSWCLYAGESWHKIRQGLWRGSEKVRWRQSFRKMRERKRKNKKEPRWRQRRLTQTRVALNGHR